MMQIARNVTEFPKLVKWTLLVVLVVGIVAIIVYGEPFLMPLAFAGLLAMLLLPMCQWMERRGLHRAIAALVSILAFLSFFAAIIYFLFLQISEMSSGAGKIEQRAKEKYEQARDYISEKLNIPKEKQEQMLKQQQQSSGGKGPDTVTKILSGIGSFFTNMLLVLVYIFLFLYFRGLIKRFIVRITSGEDQEKALTVVNKSQKVSQKYLTGLAWMIAGLWVMYGIGFSIAGVKHVMFFAVLCGVLEIVPFVGNLTGVTLTVLFSLAQSGGTNVIVGILITYVIVQFIQTYILEPLVVGAEVDINPLFTILALIAGELLWGLPGVVLAIPLLGVTKIVCDHVEPLKPFGELMGEKKKGEGKLKKKMNAFVKKIKGKF